MQELQSVLKTKLFSFLFITLSQKALKLDLNCIEAYNNEAMAEFQLKHYQKSHNIYKKLLLKLSNTNNIQFYQEIKSQILLCETKLMIPNFNNKWKCDWCNEFFEIYNDIKNHYKIHIPIVNDNGTLTYKCNKCNKTYLNEHLLKHHIVNIHVSHDLMLFKCR